jgi:tetratricopeptide (TPR) repeat protein
MMMMRGLFALTVLLAGGPAAAFADDAAAEYRAAVQALRYGDVNGAIMHASWAIRFNPAYAHAYGVRAMALQQKGQIDLAIADSTRDLVFDPADAIAYNNRGSEFAARGDHVRAIADYNAALALRPDLVEAYMGRGSEYGVTGDHDRAIADLQKAIALRPGYAEAHQNLGVTLEHAGDRDRALAEYRNALALRPDLAQARDALARWGEAPPEAIRVSAQPPLPTPIAAAPRDPVVISVSPQPSAAIAPPIPPLAARQPPSLAAGPPPLVAGQPPPPAADPLPRVNAAPLVGPQVAMATPAPQPPIAASLPLPRFATQPLSIRFAPGPDRPHDVAVIIGNANYGKFGKDIPDDLPAYADAEGIRMYARQALGIHDENIIFLKDATGAQMETVFGNDREFRGKLFDYVKPGISRVFVYFAGHGAPGATRDASPFLVPADADPASIALSGYSLATLYENLGKLPAENVTVVLESCFSGQSPGGPIIGKASPILLVPAPAAVPRNLTVIAAAGGDQMASWEKDNSDGLFTKYFLLGMSGDAARPPYGKGDGKVTLDGLDHYLKDTLTYYARRYYGRDQVAHIVKAAAGT